ncbi:hypothetical protein V5O48_004632 [Marasmius crinis-equi]|uniref:Uncharacterized protein n=1 Tax=Marasmius crinis-equi TaxID=585013 RepID=A0ABR3FPH7_9AGAR
MTSELSVHAPMECSPGIFDVQVQHIFTSLVASFIGVAPPGPSSRVIEALLLPEGWIPAAWSLEAGLLLPNTSLTGCMGPLPSLLPLFERIIPDILAYEGCCCKEYLILEFTKWLKSFPAGPSSEAAPLLRLIERWALCPQFTGLSSTRWENYRELCNVLKLRPLDTIDMSLRRLDLVTNDMEPSSRDECYRRVLSANTNPKQLTTVLGFFIHVPSPLTNKARAVGFIKVLLDIPDCEIAPLSNKARPVGPIEDLPGVTDWETAQARRVLPWREGWDEHGEAVLPWIDGWDEYREAVPPWRKVWGEYIEKDEDEDSNEGKDSDEDEDDRSILRNSLIDFLSEQSRSGEFYIDATHFRSFTVSRALHFLAKELPHLQERPQEIFGGVTLTSIVWNQWHQFCEALTDPTAEVIAALETLDLDKMYDILIHGITQNVEQRCWRNDWLALIDRFRRIAVWLQRPAKVFMYRFQILQW